MPDQYDDGGYTGANMERPGVKQLLADIEAGKVDCVVVYKVDRLSRSLIDFARMMELFDKHGVCFVSVTQQFNTTTSLGRLTLNILLSFAQFEREIISERTRDKQVAARKKGKWTGGHILLGYDLDSRGGRLVVNPEEAERVREMFRLYLEGTHGHRDRPAVRPAGLAQQAMDHAGRQALRRQPAAPVPHLQAARQRPLHRAGEGRRRDLPRRARGDHRPTDLRSGAEAPQAECVDTGQPSSRQIRCSAARA